MVRKLSNILRDIVERSTEASEDRDEEAVRWRRKFSATRLANDESDLIEVVEGLMVRTESAEEQRGGGSTANPNVTLNMGLATSKAVNLSRKQ